MTIKKSNDVKINNDFGGTLGVTDSSLTIIGDVEAERINIEEDFSRDDDIPPTSLETTNSNVVIGGSVKDSLYAVESKINVSGDVSRVVKADDSEIRIGGDCDGLTARTSEVEIEGDVKGNISKDEESEVVVEGNVEGDIVKHKTS